MSTKTNVPLWAALSVGVLAIASGCGTPANRQKAGDLPVATGCLHDLTALDEDTGKNNVCGYFLDRYPFFFLYDSNESYESNDFERAVTVRYSNCLIASGAQGIEVLNGELVMVRGSFHKESFETQGLAYGRLDGVERIDSLEVSITCEDGEMKIHDRAR